MKYFIHSKSLPKPLPVSLPRSLAKSGMTGKLILLLLLGIASIQPGWAKTRPVILQSKPNSTQDQTARLLNEDLLKDAETHHDPAVILVGSAPLSPHRKNMALFVQLQSARLCGAAGCTTSVYLKKGNEWVTVIDSVNGNISVLPTRHQGYYDLLVGEDDRWVWNGETYQDTAE